MKNLLSNITIGKEILTSGDSNTETNKFYRYWRDTDIENVLVSKKIPFNEKSYKCFIGYLYDNYKIKPLHMMLPKIEAYVKCYDCPTKWMYFLIEDDNFLEKYNTILDKVSADIKKEPNSEPVNL